MTMYRAATNEGSNKLLVITWHRLTYGIQCACTPLYCTWLAAAAAVTDHWSRWCGFYWWRSFNYM